MKTKFYLAFLEKYDQVVSESFLKWFTYIRRLVFFVIFIPIVIFFFLYISVLYENFLYKKLEPIRSTIKEQIFYLINHVEISLNYIESLSNVYSFDVTNHFSSNDENFLKYVSQVENYLVKDKYYFLQNETYIMLLKYRYYLPITKVENLFYPFQDEQYYLLNELNSRDFSNDFFMTYYTEYHVKKENQYYLLFVKPVVKSQKLVYLLVTKINIKDLVTYLSSAIDLTSFDLNFLFLKPTLQKFVAFDLSGTSMKDLDKTFNFDFFYHHYDEFFVLNNFLLSTYQKKLFYFYAMDTDLPVYFLVIFRYLDTLILFLKENILSILLFVVIALILFSLISILVMYYLYPILEMYESLLQFHNRKRVLFNVDKLNKGLENHIFYPVIEELYMLFFQIESIEKQFAKYKNHLSLITEINPLKQNAIFIQAKSFLEKMSHFYFISNEVSINLKYLQKEQEDQMAQFLGSKNSLLTKEKDNMKFISSLRVLFYDYSKQQSTIQTLLLEDMSLQQKIQKDNAKIITGIKEILEKIKQDFINLKDYHFLVKEEKILIESINFEISKLIEEKELDSLKENIKKIQFTIDKGDYFLKHFEEFLSNMITSYENTYHIGLLLYKNLHQQAKNLTTLKNLNQNVSYDIEAIDNSYIDNTLELEKFYKILKNNQLELQNIIQNLNNLF